MLKIKVKDLLALSDNKTVYDIINGRTGENLYNGRQEYLIRNKDGISDPLCEKVVVDLDVNNSCIYLEVEDTEEMLEK